MLGLANALTTYVPATPVGEFVDCVAMVWGLALTGVVIGLIGNFACMEDVVKHFEKTKAERAVEREALLPPAARQCTDVGTATPTPPHCDAL